MHVHTYLLIVDSCERVVCFLQAMTYEFIYVGFKQTVLAPRPLFSVYVNLY